MSALPTFESVIGLEVHVQLKTRTKLFCACPTDFGAPPNAQTCPTCLALPGALPVVNREAVRMAVAVGLATGCTIRSSSLFARKNYFYPDSPKGYQISQFDLPICEWGSLDVPLPEGPRRVRLRRIHLEDDAGKSIHGEGASDHTLVDLNRAGTPLIEVVGEPDLRSPDEAVAYLKTLRQLVVDLGVNDGNLEEGSVRCDANVSIRPAGTEALGTRTEIKNMNSYRGLRDAIAYEIARQTREALAGKAIVQETRLWNTDTSRTESMRSKEDAHDYRYFPEPDLLTLVVDDTLMLDARRSLDAVAGAVPDALAERDGKRPILFAAARAAFFQDACGLSAESAWVIAESLTLTRLALAVQDDARQGGADVRNALQLLSTALQILRGDGADLETSGLPPALPRAVATIAARRSAGDINIVQAKELAVRACADPEAALTALASTSQVSDDSALGDAIARVLDDSPEQVASYLGGNDKLLGFFIGRCMKALGGKANAPKLNGLLRAELDRRR